MNSSIDIRTWTTDCVGTADDISFAKSMTDIEEWGNSEADCRRLQKIQPDGCFVATRGNERVGTTDRVGMISSVAYGSYGFLGSLIVPELFRGQGIGELLMRHAIEYLNSVGVSTIELDGVMKAAPLYRRLDFKDKYHSLRFQRPPSEDPPDSNGLCLTDRVRILTSSDISEVVRFDRESIGFDRSRVLEIMADEFPGSFYGAYSSDNRLIAYLIARPIAKTSRQLGPLITIENSAAVELLSHAVRDNSGCLLSIGMPASASYICHWVLRQGFVRYSPTLRMYLGDEISYEQNVACIFSPEKG